VVVALQQMEAKTSASINGEESRPFFE
jgi:hypothetical protein